MTSILISSVSQYWLSSARCQFVLVIIMDPECTESIYKSRNRIENADILCFNRYHFALLPLQDQIARLNAEHPSICYLHFCMQCANCFISVNVCSIPSACMQSSKCMSCSCCLKYVGRGLIHDCRYEAASCFELALGGSHLLQHCDMPKSKSSC